MAPLYFLCVPIDVLWVIAAAPGELVGLPLFGTAVAAYTWPFLSKKFRAELLQSFRASLSGFCIA